MEIILNLLIWGGFLFKKVKRMPLQYKVMALTIGMVCLVLLLAGSIVIYGIHQRIEEDISQRALNIGRIIAEVPTIKNAILSDNPSAKIQPIVESWRISTGAAFIVVSNMDQIRLSHPIVENIGTPLTNLYRAPVLQGQEYLYIAKGSLDPSIRANVPIFELNGNHQIGFVSVGFYLKDVYIQQIAGAKNVLYALVIALILSIIGSVLVSKNVKKAIYGLEPYEIATLLREKEVTLDSIREGVIAVDLDGQIRLINNEAKAIIGQQSTDAYGQPIDKFLKQLDLESVIHTGIGIYDTEQRINDTIILANIAPIIVEGDAVGAVITFRDRTEISRLAEEMTGVHGFVDIMRAQAHEVKNKLHVIAGLIQLGSYDEAVDLIVDGYANNQDEFEKLRSTIKDTMTFGLLVGKMSRAKELGIDFVIAPETLLTTLPGQLTSGDMVIILGNLIENALEAVAKSPVKQVIVSITENTSQIKMSIKNSGLWIDDEVKEAIYQRGFSSKGENRGYGLALAAEKVHINNGTISHTNLPEGGVVFEVLISQTGRGDRYE